MISQLEFHSRAELCRQLARLEPSNKTFWMAEAESWSRLSNGKFPGEDEDRFRAPGNACECGRQDICGQCRIAERPLLKIRESRYRA